MITFLSILLGVISLTLVGGLVGMFYYEINKDRNKIAQEKYELKVKKLELEKNKVTIRPEEELMQIVYGVLERKWAYRVQFHFKIKEIKVPKFEYELNYLLTETMNSLSKDIIEELRYYYKDDETVIKMVSEVIQIFLLNYMEQSNMKG